MDEVVLTAAEIRAAVRRALVAKLIELGRSGSTADRVRVRTDAELARIAKRLDREDAAQAALRARIGRYLDRPGASYDAVDSVFPAPPGSPIGVAGAGPDEACSWGSGR